MCFAELLCKWQAGRAELRMCQQTDQQQLEVLKVLVWFTRVKLRFCFAQNEQCSLKMNRNEIRLKWAWVRRWNGSNKLSWSCQTVQAELHSFIHGGSEEEEGEEKKEEEEARLYFQPAPWIRTHLFFSPLVVVGLFFDLVAQKHKMTWKLLFSSSSFSSTSSTFSPAPPTTTPPCLSPPSLPPPPTYFVFFF